MVNWLVGWFRWVIIWHMTTGPLLGVNYPLYVWLSLLPIVAGCSMSAMKEVSFVWAGFNNAMISNLGMVLRNIYSKKSLANYKVRTLGLQWAE